MFELETIPGSLIECIQKEISLSRMPDSLRNGRKPNDESGSFMYALSDVTLCAPIPRPSKNVICIGKNYRDHAVEMGSEADIPEHPMVFTKAPAAVTGHGETVKSHLDVTEQLDYEGSLR